MIIIPACTQPEKTLQLGVNQASSGQVNQVEITPPGEAPEQEWTEQELQEQRLLLYAEDLNQAYEMQELDFFDEVSGHRLTIYELIRSNNSAIDAPDRGLRRLLGFWDQDVQAVLYLDTVSAYYYTYFYDQQSYQVELQTTEANFSEHLRTFELRAKLYNETLLVPPIPQLSNSQLNEQACAHNRRLLHYADENVGRRVGDGECWTLLAEALPYAAAYPPIFYRFGSLLGEGDGDDVSVLAVAQPGDILQFDAAYFEDEQGFWRTVGEPNHSSMIRSVQGEEISVYEQNMPYGSEVTINHYDFADLQSGRFFLYRAYSDAVIPDYCVGSSGVSYAYDAYPNQRGNGILLTRYQSFPAGVSALAYCQHACDQDIDCTGLSYADGSCELMAGTETSAQTASTWFVKVR